MIRAQQEGQRTRYSCWRPKLNRNCVFKEPLTDEPEGGELVGESRVEVGESGNVRHLMKCSEEKKPDDTNGDERRLRCLHSQK